MNDYLNQFQAAEKRWFFALFTLLLCSMMGNVKAESGVYRYVDAQGVLHLTNRSPQQNAEEQRQVFALPQVPREVYLGSRTVPPVPQVLSRAKEIHLGNRPVNFSPPDYSETENTRDFSLPAWFEKPYAEIILVEAMKAGLDPALVHAVIQVESAYQADIMSPKGALGLMQLMPATAEFYGVSDRSDPQQNVRGGITYLKDLLQTFQQDTSLALAAYNSGAGAVKKYGNKIPPYPETVNYVAKVMGVYQGYRPY